jgi:[acyl-carrier-protein] S-malonyltransferase
MQAAADRLASDVARVPLNDLAVPLVNNADAKPIRTAAEVRASLIRQLPSSVLWEDSVRVLKELGVRTLVEVGPGTVLSGLAKRIATELRVLNVQDPTSLAATVEALGSCGA